jgi:hypothetical protein
MHEGADRDIRSAPSARPDPRSAVEALRSLLIRHRSGLRRACVLGAAGVPLAFGAAAAVVHGWDAKRFLLFYMAPFFPAFFLWARRWLDEIGTHRPAALVVDTVAVVLAATRMAGTWLPVSGHMLFYAYAGLTTRSLALRVLIGALAAIAAWFKLVLWGDGRSLGLGIAAGLALAAVRLLAARTPAAPPPAT